MNQSYLANLSELWQNGAQIPHSITNTCFWAAFQVLSLATRGFEVTVVVLDLHGVISTVCPALLNMAHIFRKWPGPTIWLIALRLSLLRPIEAAYCCRNRWNVVPVQWFSHFTNHCCENHSSVTYKYGNNKTDFNSFLWKLRVVCELQSSLRSSSTGSPHWLSQ